jgi:hypothetical protein
VFWVAITTAVGTAGAAIVALGLGLKAEWRATRLEREQHEQEERRQAIHVEAWLWSDRTTEAASQRLKSTVHR